MIHTGVMVLIFSYLAVHAQQSPSGLPAAESGKASSPKLPNINVAAPNVSSSIASSSPIVIDLQTTARLEEQRLQFEDALRARRRLLTNDNVTGEKENFMRHKSSFAGIVLTCLIASGQQPTAARPEVPAGQASERNAEVKTSEARPIIIDSDTTARLEEQQRQFEELLRAITSDSGFRSQQDRISQDLMQFKTSSEIQLQKQKMGEDLGMTERSAERVEALRKMEDAIKRARPATSPAQPARK